jgi:uncharacterized protein
MKLTLDAHRPGYTIRSYRPGSVTINDQEISRSVIVTPGELVHDWPPQTFEQLDAAHVARLAELRPRPELVILGVGPHVRFPPPSCLSPLLEAGIGVEIMDTGAACRTYNLLVADGRAAAAALLML